MCRYLLHSTTGAAALFVARRPTILLDRVVHLLSWPITLRNRHRCARAIASLSPVISRIEHAVGNVSGTNVLLGALFLRQGSQAHPQQLPIIRAFVCRASFLVMESTTARPPHYTFTFVLLSVTVRRGPSLPVEARMGSIHLRSIEIEPVLFN